MPSASTYLQLLRLISFYHLRHHPLRTTISIIVMAFGVASIFWAVVGLANNDQLFGQGVNVLTGRADLEVRAGDETDLTNAYLQAIRQTSGVDTAAPLVSGAGVVLGESELLVLWGVDLAVEQAVRDYPLATGRFPVERGEILLNEAYAVEKGYTIDQSIKLVGPGGVHSFTITGMLADEGLAALNGGDFVLLNYEDSQLLRDDAILDSISIRAANGHDIDALATRVAAVLPYDARAADPDSYYTRALVTFIRDMLVVITNALPAAVGALIIFNTLAAFVAQRRQEIGILRALGLTSNSIRTLFLVESLVLGVAACVLGLVIASMIPGYDNEIEVGDFEAALTLDIPVWSYPFTFALGLIIAVLAGMLPARRAARVEPLEIIRQPRMEVGTVHFGPVRLVVGVLLLVGVLGLRETVNHTDQAIIMPVASVLMILLGSTLLFPPLMVWAFQWLPPVAQRLFGTSGLLAAESLAKRPQRIVSTGIMVLLVVVFAAMGNGLERGGMRFVDDLLDQERLWDLTVAGAGTDVMAPLTSIPDDVVTAISTRPTVAAAVAESYGTVTYDDFDYVVRAVDVTAFRAHGGQFPVDQGNADVIYTRLQDHDRPALLTGGYNALLDGLKQVGHTVTLETPSGPVTFEIIGTIYAPGIIGDTVPGMLVMDRALYCDLWNDPATDRLLLQLQPGADVQAERRDLLRRYTLHGILVVNHAELRESAVNPAAGMSVLMAMLLPIMVLGIANTLFIAVLDRRREIGMLRAVGTLRHQITRGIMLEAVFLVIITCLWGIPMAFYSIEMMLFKEITDVSIRPDLIGITITVAELLLAGAVAAYLPARRAGRIDVLDALHYE